MSNTSLSTTLCAPTPIIRVCQTATSNMDGSISTGKMFMGNLNFLRFKTSMNDSTGVTNASASVCAPIPFVNICAGGEYSQENGFRFVGSFGTSLPTINLQGKMSITPQSVIENTKTLINGLKDKVGSILEKNGLKWDDLYVGVGAGDNVNVVGNGEIGKLNSVENIYQNVNQNSVVSVISEVDVNGFGGIVCYDTLRNILIDLCFNRGRNLLEEHCHRRDKSWWMSGEMGSSNQTLHTICCEKGRNGHNRIWLMENKIQFCTGCNTPFLLEMFYCYFDL